MNTACLIARINLFRERLLRWFVEIGVLIPHLPLPPAQMLCLGCGLTTP
jgi:hypothetical protein